MNRVAFLVDGFNLYHSLRQASRDLRGATTKWLDIDALCRQHLSALGNGAAVGGIYYFSALAHHLQHNNPDVVIRHQAFIACLLATGVTVELARFKEKRIWCDVCKSTLVRHEEKETDVAIASKLFELLYLGACDSIVLVTGDTDLAPAVRTAHKLFPMCDIRFAFPYGRKKNELAKLAPGSFRLSSASYVNNQFTDPYVDPSGKAIAKPSTW